MFLEEKREKESRYGENKRICIKSVNWYIKSLRGFVLKLQTHNHSSY